MRVPIWAVPVVVERGANGVIFRYGKCNPDAPPSRQEAEKSAFANIAMRNAFRKYLRLRDAGEGHNRGI
jgi:hypothetical protein